MALSRAQTGDTEAFRMLVEQNSQRMFRLAYRMTGNEQDAEDVVQETFLRAYGKLQQYESRAHFSSWLHRIAANYAIDLLRRRKRWRKADLDSLEVHSPLTSDDPAQDSSVFGSEIQQRIDQELARLTPKERVAFTLRHHEGLSIKEISKVMKSRDGATKNRIFRAVKKMRVALQPMVDEKR